MSDFSQPRSIPDHAAQAAFEAIEDLVKQHGATLQRVFVLLHGKGFPDGEPNATLAGYNYDDPDELLADLLHAATKVGEQLGVTVRLVRDPGGHG